MLSKGRMRLVRSLQDDKARARLRLYVVEGDRMVRDYLAAGHPVEQLYATDDWCEALPEFDGMNAGEVTRVSRAELEKLSALATPQNAIAVVPMPDEERDAPQLPEGLAFGLDAVRDPGNLGSLLRVAAWFGISRVVCSPDCVDPYNPKVVQATMGALLHVGVSCAPLASVLRAATSFELPVYGTMLDGEPIYEAELEERGIILLGNEARGLSDDLLPWITRRITIPPWTAAAPGKESLNVAVAAAVVCSEFRRRGRPSASRG